jgi:hypothetical protein
MLKYLATFSFTLAVLPAFAQEMTEEIVVTGIRASDMYETMPAVTLKKTADFMVQRIKIVNDSRSEEQRNTEIRETLQNLNNGAKKHDGLQISYGEDYLQPLDPKDPSLIFKQDSRADTSVFYLSVKQKINPEKPPILQKDELIKFIKDTKKSGRTEIDIPSGIDLSIVSPERYRNEIIKRIGEENQAIKSSIGDSCSLTIDGLGNRVEWEQSGMTELMLYIPYNTQVSCQ